MKTKAIIGLGNPGPSFHWTPHNLGFRIIDALAERFAATFNHDDELEADVAVVTVDSTRYVLVKPTTGMNDSGRTAAAVVSRYTLALEDLLVTYDDVSLPLGRMRFQHAGSAGGHHGIENIIACLQDRRDFTRLKVAVGPDPGGAARFAYVLAPLPDELRPLFCLSIATAVDAAVAWSERGVQQAMNGFNGTDLRKKEQ